MARFVEHHLYASRYSESSDESESLVGNRGGEVDTLLLKFRPSGLDVVAVKRFVEALASLPASLVDSTTFPGFPGES